MNTGKIVFLTNILFCVNSYCSGIYFVSGAPRTNDESVLPTTLYTLNAGQFLRSIDEIIPDEGNTYFIRPYYDLRVIIVREHYPRNHPGEGDFSVIPMDKPDQIQKRKIVYDVNRSFLEDSLINIPGDGVYQSFRLGNAIKNIIELVGVNLLTGEQKVLPFSSYKYVVMGGFAGTFADGGEFVLVTLKSDGKVVERYWGDKADFGLTIPAELIRDKKETAVLYAINKEIIAIRAYWKDSKLEEKNQVEYLAYSKSQQKWSSVLFDGSRSRVFGYGPWLTGLEAEPRKGRHTFGPGMPDPNIVEPQIDVPSPDGRFALFDVYSTGKLFFYNVLDGRKIIFDTEFYDSEALLIQDDKLIYRIGDTIYTAEIKGNTIENKSVLVKDKEIVPNIHWAFIGPDPKNP